MSELVRWSLEDHLGRKGSGRNEVLSPRRIRNRKRRNKGGWHPIPRRRCSPWPWAILPGSSTIDSGSDRPLLRVDQNVNRISHLLNNSGFFPISYYPFAGFRRWNNKGGASALPFHHPRKCWPCWRKSFGTGRKPICIEKQHSQRCHVISIESNGTPPKRRKCGWKRRAACVQKVNWRINWFFVLHTFLQADGRRQSGSNRQKSCHLPFILRWKRYKWIRTLQIVIRQSTWWVIYVHYTIPSQSVTE